jgi:hypothetical protein
MTPEKIIAKGLRKLPEDEQRILIEEAGEKYRTLNSRRRREDIDRDDAELLTIQEAGLTA